MKQTHKGYECPNCGHMENVDLIEVRLPEKSQEDQVYVMNSMDDSQRVQRSCPECGYNEAFKKMLVAQGEHAGVKQDRSLAKYACTDCGYTWSE